MPLSIRPKVYSLPSYSLTGDLLGYLRCGLQYRYSRLGKLPPSRPVQQWFGEYIHGVLEEAFRRFKESIDNGSPSLPPWSQAELQDIQALIKKRLEARGLYAWNGEVERLGSRRGESAIQELGPHLFPLIHRAEVRLTGARLLPEIDPQFQFRTADRYEVVGVVDVVTHIEIDDPALAGNPIVSYLHQALGEGLPDQFEIIVDYKGMRRPPVSSAGSGSLWTQYQWQIQTYGELRRVQPDALHVAGGVLLYINELSPTRGDLERLKAEIANGTTDVPPPPGSADEAALRDWKTRDKNLPTLSFGYRLSRALRVVPITPESIGVALEAFDGVVREIESCRGREANGGSVIQSWTRNSNEESTCVVCDSRTYCPDYQTNYASKHGDNEPRLPGVKDTP